MALKLNTTKPTVRFNTHGWHARWPLLWIVILGIILVLLCLIIVGMEIGHTVVDVYRSTAFGGFILFIPFLVCAIFVIVVAFKPRHNLVLITILLCCIMIILCILLIAYDILVLVDPTRCFFLNCANAQVTYQVTSTSSATITGWPLYISWPSYFQTNMNAKRIFMGIQLLCAGLFILCCALFILTYIIYRHIDLNKQTMYAPERRPYVTNEPTREAPPNKYNHVSPQSNSSQHIIRRPNVTTYTIQGHPYSSTRYHYSPSPAAIVNQPSPIKTEKKTPPQTSSVKYERVCIRCLKEPRILLTTNYERQNYFSHLCINCNNELESQGRKPPIATDPNTDRTWKP